MSGGKRTRLRRVQLTDRQRRLVRENIGLVMVHLRRHVGSAFGGPRRDREWEDLFQEGCLGLIRAAIAFRKEAGIPFAAFALPRIHNAVSRALHNKFSTIHVPPKYEPTHSAGQAGAEPRTEHKRPRVHSLSNELERGLAEKTRHDPAFAGSAFGGPNPDGTMGGSETIGERLRGKYERAVRAAADAMSSAPAHGPRRQDRHELVRILTEERLLVPHEESRTALRKIARQTKSSNSRVTQCEKGLRGRIRHRLEADPEFRELQRRARTSPNGTGVPIDDELERELAAASAEEFVRRFHLADPQDRTRLLDVLLQISEHKLDDVLRERVAQLAMPMRELLLQSAPGPPQAESDEAYSSSK